MSKVTEYWTQDWRDSAGREAWDEIRAWLLNDEEHAELLAILVDVVPKRERGHGVETYSDFIPPHEAKTHKERDACDLLHKILQTQRDRQNLLGQPFDDAISYAIEYVEGCNIRYEGWHDTYLYWDANSDGLVQHSRDIVNQFHEVEAALAAHEKIWPRGNTDEGTQLAEAYWSFMDRPEWKMARSLAWWFTTGMGFEPFTPIHHALSILYWYHSGFRRVLREYPVEINGRMASQRHVKQNFLAAAKAGYEIGWHHEALLKKDIEPHTLRGMRTLESAVEGGAVRRGKMQGTTHAVLQEMQRLSDTGHSISRAAELAAGKGIGTSHGANRKLWYQHKRQ